MKKLILISCFLYFELCCKAIEKQPLEKTQTIFFHGVVDNSNQARLILLNKTIFGSLIAPNFADSEKSNSAEWTLSRLISDFTSTTKISKHRPNGRVINLEKMFLGQGPDIDLAMQTIKNNSGKTTILYGASRGAATVISALGEMGKRPEEYKDMPISAVVLESPVADMLSNVPFYSAKAGFSIPESLFRLLFYQYPQVPYTPLEAIQDIADKNIPIFIFTTAEDTVIDPAQPWILYLAFKSAGFKNVYISESPQGKHCKMHREDSKITHQYYHAQVQAFYKKHGLHEEYAEAFDCDKITVEDLQPSIEEAQKKIDFYNKKRAEQFNKNRARNIGIVMILGLAIYLIKNRKKK